VGPDSESFSSRFLVEDVSLVSGKRDIRRFDSEVMIQIRYRSVPVPGKVTLDDSGGGRVELKEPARAITPGQVAAWYDGDEVLGAGTISRVER
jgi:tRNA-specific 2-thiouridylase